jgi:hypothetical protein
MKRTVAPTYAVDIYMAVDIDLAKTAMRRYCMDFGFCVNTRPTDYIYTGGEESGFVVGIINWLEEYRRLYLEPQKELEGEEKFDWGGCGCALGDDSEEIA